MKSESKTVVGLALFAFLGWGCFMFQARQPPKETTVYQDRVVVKDRVVQKNTDVNKTRTTTFPNGTKVVETDESKVQQSKQEHTSESEKIRQVTRDVPVPLARYSLGLSVRLDPFNPLDRIYQVDFGRRLWTTPIWARVAVSSDKTLSLGLAVEF